MADKIQGSAEIQEEKKVKKKKSGGCLIILLILLLTPLLIVGGLYYFNKDFKLSVNSLMSNVPGPVGSYFETFPTREEEQEQIRVISDYMLSIEQDRAVDKLMVLSNEDKSAYNEVIKDMLRINPNRTKSLLDQIRALTVQEDAIMSTVNQIASEQDNNLQEIADYWSGLPTTSAIDEIEQMIGASINGYKDVADIVELMESDVAEKILYELDSTELTKIMSYLSDPKALSIREAHAFTQRKETDLEQLAGVYKSEDPETLIQTLGDSLTYSIEELAVIYRNMGAKKAGEVLAKSQNDTFVLEVVAKMKENERLKNGQDNFTSDVLKSLKVYKEFDDNVVELVKVYSKMGTDKVADILKNMLLNAAPSEVYDLDNGDFITISDEMLVLEILKSFSETQKAEIISLLDNTLSTEITRMLALPKN
jgi:flagellar motility protein MotE (MotC chaperone)